MVIRLVFIARGCDRLGPGTFCLLLDTPFLQQQNTKKRYGTKNNCVDVQLGEIMDEIYKETKPPPQKKTQIKNTTAILKSLEQKPGTEHVPCTQHHLRGGQTT